ncbi:hypothetical protein D915_005989 [Fasciola hepatica]|uniref:Uncharacterized protein n=1 Tax=Fasciola hepatica TaxID=6192 RepID=A0A2H1C7M2_FASHE|nr:hypothetical protein D915_005989 [Fasciola hepatica]
MPRTTLVNTNEVLDEKISVKRNTPADDSCLCHCRINWNFDFDWDAFTLYVGLIFLFFGFVCCLTQITSVLWKLQLECYGVGLWCSAGFLVSAIFATKLYMKNRVAPVVWMIASVVCDLSTGVVLPMVGACLASQCVHESPIFIGVTIACFFGILTAASHAALFVREIVKLRYQLKRKPPLSEGLSRALKLNYNEGN